MCIRDRHYNRVGYGIWFTTIQRNVAGTNFEIKSQFQDFLCKTKKKVEYRNSEIKALGTLE